MKYLAITVMLIVSACATSPDETYRALYNRCEALDNELVQAQIDEVANVEHIRMQRQKACASLPLWAIILYGEAPIN